MSDTEIVIEEILEDQQRRLDEMCASVKAQVRQELIEANKDRVRPVEMPLWQWDQIRADSLAHSDGLIDEFFRQKKLLVRCQCGAPWDCPIHFSGKPQ